MHLWGFVSSQDLYKYDRSKIEPFEKYGIEQQAQILQDAYRVVYGEYKGKSERRKVLDPNLARKDMLLQKIDCVTWNAS